MVRPVEIKLRTSQALYDLEAIRKSSEGYLTTARQIAHLEVATIQDAATYAQQVLSDIGDLSNPSTHLWQTFTQLLFAIAVPFSLVYPASALAGARTLNLKVNPPENLPTRIMRQGKQWIVNHPGIAALTTTTFTLAGLTFAASQILYSLPQQNNTQLNGHAGCEFPKSSNGAVLLTALSICALGTIALCKLLGSKTKSTDPLVKFPMPSNAPLMEFDTKLKQKSYAFIDGQVQEEVVKIGNKTCKLYRYNDDYYIEKSYNHFFQCQRINDKIQLNNKSYEISYTDLSLHDAPLNDFFVENKKVITASIETKLGLRGEVLWLSINDKPYPAALYDGYKMDIKVKDNNVIFKDRQAPITYQKYEWSEYLDKNKYSKIKEQNGIQLRLFIVYNNFKYPILKHPYHSIFLVNTDPNDYVISEIHSPNYVSIKVNGKLHHRKIYEEPINPIRYQDASIIFDTDKKNIRQKHYRIDYDSYYPIKSNSNEEQQICCSYDSYGKIAEIPSNTKAEVRKIKKGNQGLSVTIDGTSHRLCKFGNDHFLYLNGMEWHPVTIDADNCRYQEKSYPIDRTNLQIEFQGAEVYRTSDQTTKTEYIVDYNEQLLPLLISNTEKILGICPKNEVVRVIETLQSHHVTIDGFLYRVYEETQSFRSPPLFKSIDPRCFGPCNPNSKNAAVPIPSTFMRNSDGQLQWTSGINPEKKYALLSTQDIARQSHDYIPDPLDDQRIQHALCNNKKVFWLNIDGKEEIVGIDQGNKFQIVEQIDDLTIKVDGKEEKIQKETIGIEEAFYEAKQSTCGLYDLEYLQFLGQECPIFYNYNNSYAIPIGEKLICAFVYIDTISFIYEGQGYSARILKQSPSHLLEKYQPAQPLEKYHTDSQSFTIEQAGGYDVIRNPDDPSIVILREGGQFCYGKVSYYDTVTRKGHYIRKLGKIKDEPLPLDKVYASLPEFEMNRPDFATNLFFSHNGKEIPLRAWPSRKAPQVYLAKSDSTIVPVPIKDRNTVIFDGKEKQIEKCEMDLKSKFDGIHDWLSKQYCIQEKIYTLRSISNNLFVAKSDCGKYFIAHDLNGYGKGTLKLNGIQYAFQSA